MRHCKRRGQISSQVFMFIMASIIIGLVIIIGTRSFVRMHTMSSKAEVAELKKNLNEMIYNIDYGDSKIESINLPSGVEEVCFCGRNTGVYGLPKCNGGSDANIKLRKKNNDNETIFIKLIDGTLNSLTEPKLFSDGLICVNRDSNRVRLKGVAGGNVLVEKLR